jgi:hypothetical protein
MDMSIEAIKLRLGIKDPKPERIRKTVVGANVAGK